MACLCKRPRFLAVSFKRPWALTRENTVYTCTGWGRVTSIREEVHEGAGNGGLLGSHQQCLQVGDVAVDTTVTDQAQEMETTSPRLGGVEGLDESRLVVDGLVLNGQVDGYYVLQM